jgi:hypothetical protein
VAVTPCGGVNQKPGIGGILANPNRNYQNSSVQAQRPHHTEDVAGIANAQAKGVRIGRQRVNADASAVAQLRSEGLSWSEVCRATGLFKGKTAQRAAMSASQAVMQ